MGFAEEYVTAACIVAGVCKKGNSMKEYIEREAVCYQLAKQATIDGQPRAIKRATKIVANIPAADVREVVLCRDCKYYNDETCDRWSDGTYLKPNDFCSRAARI